MQHKAFYKAQMRVKRKINSTFGLIKKAFLSIAKKSVATPIIKHTPYYIGMVSRQLRLRRYIWMMIFSF